MTRLRGLIALVAAVAFVAGVPWLLLTYGDWPITGMPSVGELRDLADTVVSDTMVFGVLTVAAWMVWAGFAVSLLVESAAVVRGVQAPRLAFAGPLQRSARALVAAIVLAVSLSHNQPAAFAAGQRATSAVPFPRPAAHVTHIVEPVRIPHLLDSADVVHAATGDAGIDQTGSAVTVGRGDSAWALAEQHLGDGMRWRELWELNRDRPQPDGRVWTDPQVILPGWQLRLPVSVTSPPAAPTWAATSDVHVVVPGDTLSGIAEAHLGNPDLYTDIFDLNRHVVQADGRRLTDADLILPGWQLRLPSSEPAGETSEPTPAAESPAPNTTVTATAPEPPPSPHETEVTGTSAGPTAPSMPHATPPPPAAVEPAADAAAPPAPENVPATTLQPSEPAPARSVAAAEDDESWWGATAPVLAGVSGATVLATGLLLRLRRSHRRRMLRGANDALITRSEAERAVIAAADVPLVRWAGQALADMMSRLTARDTARSAPIAVELSPESGIELLWDSPNPDSPAPWLAADEGWAWRLAYDLDAEVPADALPAAIPALVTIGHREGRQLMVDLEAFGAVAVTGDTERVDEFLRAAALELSAGDDLADSYVLTIGVDGLVASDRLTKADLETVAARAESIRHSVRGALDSAATPTSFAYRCGDGAHLESTVVIVATNDGDDLTPLLTVRPREGLAVVAAGELADAGALIEIASDGTARLDPLGISFVAAGVPRETAAAVEDLPDDTTNDEAGHLSFNGHSAGPVRMERLSIPSLNGDAPALFELPVDGDGVDADDDELLQGSPLEASLVVKVLGTPRVPDRPDLKRRELILTVYLACRGGRVNASAVQDALWNGQAVQGKTVWNLVGQTRKALGELPDGTWALPPSDRMRNMKGMSPGVTTDLAIFRYLCEQAQTASSSEAIGLLRQAVALVEGPPFDAPGYDWAHHGTQDVAEACRLIEQATEQLVNLALDVDDVDIAREAIAQGLRGLPGDEVLYRLRMKVEHHAGNLTGVSAAFDELVRHLSDFDADPSPSTLELRRELLGTARSSGA